MFYVSASNREETTYRGGLGQRQLEVWLIARAGDNGRGIGVDDAGGVYVSTGSTLADGFSSVS